MFTSVIPFISPDLINRFVDPAVCILVGAIVGPTLSLSLGLWLILAGFALYFVEQIAKEQQENQILDAIDAEITAQEMSQALERFESGNQDVPRVKDTSGARPMDKMVMKLLEKKKKRDPQSPGGSGTT